MLPGLQSLTAGIGDHGAVIPAELQTREVGAAAFLGGHDVQFLPHEHVGADAAGDDQPLEPGLPQGATGLDEQGVDHRCLEASGNVGAVLWRTGAGFQGNQRVGLEPAETEVQTGSVGHWPRETEASSVTRFGQLGDGRPAGVAQTQHLGGLVEGLACGVVHRFTQNPVAADAGDLHQLGVATGDKQGEERKFGRIRFQQRGEQVAFHVVDADGWHIQAPGQAAGDRGTSQQGADQAGPAGVGDAVECLERDAGIGADLPDERHELADVVTRRQFRYDAAVLGVNVDLAVQPMTEQTSLAGV